MAIRKHFEILEKGVKVWNSWRIRYPKIRPNLSEIELPSAKLDGINLSKANLASANLQGAFLIGATLA